MTDDCILVNDVIEWADNMGEPHRWRVIGIHLGALGQEGLIECESITHKPGWTEDIGHHPRVWIPEVLCRRLRVVYRETLSK